MLLRELAFVDVLQRSPKLRPLHHDDVESLRPAVRRGTARPPGVEQHGTRFRLVFHFDTFVAMKAEGLSEGVFQVMEGPTSPKQVILERVRENEVRRDFSLTDRLGDYTRLMDTFCWTQAQLADQLKRSESYVSKVLNLGKKLHPAVMAMLVDHKIAGRAARAVSFLPWAEQAEFAKRVWAENWTVKRVECAVKDRLGKAPPICNRSVMAEMPTGNSVTFLASQWSDFRKDLMVLARAVKHAHKLGLGPEDLPGLLSY